ncbi:hypothetical protein AnigIFM56816_006830 [Aspergillus niger]|uniref:DnaJ C terminal domain family protein n=1 Tax=Aspergillus niger TaxID=5061 RepID=A0A505HXD2_ASPNG|nr:DnaJ C terminal domain family protein [Aspergillus niger]GJP89651.1 DnaJ C terminal domain family protein [Aspergillus niger]GKZ76563.1 hypothetical protein AnigIFM56816_006830 [Aspergillus niger]GLA45237.1 hypothetical protein AnigIFM63604_003677 [Aspergillus niger]
MQSINFVAKGRSPDSTTMANESSIEFPQGVYDPVRRVQLHQVPLQEIRNLFPETPALTLASVGSHPRLGSGREKVYLSRLALIVPTTLGLWRFASTLVGGARDPSIRHVIRQ